MDESVETLRELLTLDELTHRVGMSVRNVRFYTTKGLVPPPIRRGRSGYYPPDHVARLELVQRAAEPRLHAVRDREVRRQHPRRRHAPRTSPCTGRCWRPGRPSRRRDVSRARARQARRAAAQRRRPRHARRAGHRLPDQAGPATRSRSRSSRSASGCSTSASRPRPRSPRPTCTPQHGRADRRGALRRCSAPRCGRPTRSPATPARAAARGRRAAQAAVDRAAWSRPTSPRWTRPSARASPSAPAAHRARRGDRPPRVGPMSPSPTVLVTGATGFIGRRLVPELVDRGHEGPGDDPPPRGVRRTRRGRGRRRARPGRR